MQIITIWRQKKAHFPPIKKPQFLKNSLESNMFDHSVRFGTEFAQ
jgi:hypothetical protein